MKNFLKTGSAAALSVMLLTGGQKGFAADVGSPEAVNVKLYELWVSRNADCTNMTRVYNNSNPDYQNVAANISFGRVAIPNGVYHCIAFKMSDIMQIVPAFTSDSGNCVQGVTYTRDLFRGGDTSIAPDGTVYNGSGTNPTGQIEDGMYVYLSTNGTTGDDASGTRPTLPDIMTSPYVVSGDNVATMVWDMTNGVEDVGVASGGCSVETVVFGFRYR
jgi:hypothetical protein